MLSRRPIRHLRVVGKAPRKFLDRGWALTRIEEVHKFGVRALGKEIKAKCLKQYFFCLQDRCTPLLNLLKKIEVLMIVTMPNILHGRTWLSSGICFGSERLRILVW